MSNVKAGDLAIIKCGYPLYDGRIVEVIGDTPRGRFYLPSGDLQAPLDEPGWVIRFIGGPAPIPMTNGSARRCYFACAEKRLVFPLPGDPESVDEREEAEA